MNIPEATRLLLEKAAHALANPKRITSSPSPDTSDDESKPKPRSFGQQMQQAPPPPPPGGPPKRPRLMMDIFDEKENEPMPNDTDEVQESDRYLLEHAPEKIRTYKFLKNKVDKDILVLFRRWKSMKHITTKQFIESASEYSNLCHREWLQYDWKGQANEHFIKNKALEALKLKIEKWETLAEPCVNMTIKQLDAKADRLDEINTQLAEIENEFPEIMQSINRQEEQVKGILLTKKVKNFSEPTKPTRTKPSLKKPEQNL